jgi:hypothetical protein
MRRLSFLRTVAAIVSLSIASLGFIHVAHAGIIGTPQVVQSAEHTAQIEKLQALIASEQVSAQLVALGVDPEWAAERVASLTPEEIAGLDGQLEQLPAGGSVLAVIGIVFVVLLILEITGVIDIFKKV